MKNKIEDFRPAGFEGRGDKYLAPLADDLEKVIDKLEKNYAFEALKLDKAQKHILAMLLIEFAEDLHNDIGLWRSIEYYNKSMFNTPLPLFINSKQEIKEVFDKNRIKFFIYTILFEFEPELTLSPKFEELEILADGIRVFLNTTFKKVPKDSGIKQYLSQPNEHGVDFKRKLVWVGTNSYLFRYSCLRYADERNNGKMEIGTIDDFICQENTIWSGLGVIDILAKALELPQKIQNDVRSWYERLLSLYRIISNENNILKLENLITGTIYNVYIDIKPNPFKKDEIVYGSIVPYGDYYYWSGEQKLLGKNDDKKIEKIKDKFVRDVTRVVYRYDKKLLSKAQEDIKVHYADFKNFFGNDLVTFKDGLTMAAAIQQKDKKKYETLSKEELDDIMKRRKLKNPFPEMELPDNLLNAENGIGVYFNPDEGSEMMTGFDEVLSGFKKKGNNLTEEEGEAIREFIFADSISPNFVNKLIKDYGDKSISKSFFLNTEDSNTEYLLHRYKGHFFRNRYPEISYIE